jgi:hypothetical protein
MNELTDKQKKLAIELRDACNNHLGELGQFDMCMVLFNTFLLYTSQAETRDTIFNFFIGNSPRAFKSCCKAVDNLMKEMENE